MYDRQYFSSILRDYRRHFFHPFFWWRVGNIVRLHPGSLLDVGCGVGILVEVLRKRGIQAWGLDLSPAGWETAPEDLQSCFTSGDIRKLPYPDGSFDVVTCVDVLEHIRREDLPGAIAECVRVAGRLVYLDITVTEDFLFINGDPSHVTKMRRNEWFGVIGQAVGERGRVRKGPIFPLVHHGVFIVEKPGFFS